MFPKIRCLEYACIGPNKKLVDFEKGNTKEKENTGGSLSLPSFRGQYLVVGGKLEQVAVALLEIYVCMHK